MMLQDKMVQFNAAVLQAATDLGLVFAWGPEPGEYPADLALGTPAFNTTTTNGQERGCYNFAVTEIE